MAEIETPEIQTETRNEDPPTSTDAVHGDRRSAQARPTAASDDKPILSDCEPPKKRKTRRGKAKRRNAHPYLKSGNNVKKPEAPYNSNRFLIEDHGDVEDIDEELKKADQASTSTVTRTRDSSFSIDSDGEFYSTPDYEDEFLIKDFDTQYESLQAERLQSMSKDELIQEFLTFERKLEGLTSRLRKPPSNLNNCKSDGCQNDDCRKEIQKLTLEIGILRQENESLKTNLSLSSDSDSADSETDSSGTCSSVTSSLSRPPTPIDSSQMNGTKEETSSTII